MVTCSPELRSAEKVPLLQNGSNCLLVPLLDEIHLKNVVSSKQNWMLSEKSSCHVTLWLFQLHRTWTSNHRCKTTDHILDRPSLALPGTFENADLHTMEEYRIKIEMSQARSRAKMHVINGPIAPVLLWKLDTTLPSSLLAEQVCTLSEGHPETQNKDCKCSESKQGLGLGPFHHQARLGGIYEKIIENDGFYVKVCSFAPSPSQQI